VTQDFLADICRPTNLRVMEDSAGAARPADPMALRALAHPVRWKLIDVLASEGTVTVTRCAQLLGESTATCSYHLGILAKYGYITRVAGREWREKPWRLVSPDLDLSSSGLDREGTAASRAAAVAFLDYEMTLLKESLNRSEHEPSQWPATKIMRATAWVTAEESREAAAEVQKVLDKYSQRGKGSRPPGAREVRLFAAIASAAVSSPSDG
jgi:Helix-turn-helix domain